MCVSHSRASTLAAATIGVVPRMAAVAVVIAAVAATTASVEAARGVPTGSLRATAGPLVFFRTVPNNSLRPLRRVLRVNPRTGRSLPSVTLPRDARTFVDATQVGDTSFFANSDDRTDYNAIEAVEVDIRRARVLHRTRFADDADRPSRLPYALDVRVS